MLKVWGLKIFWVKYRKNRIGKYMEYQKKFEEAVERTKRLNLGHL